MTDTDAVGCLCFEIILLVSIVNKRIKRIESICLDHIGTGLILYVSKLLLLPIYP